MTGPLLFQPMTIRGATLPNRIVLAPLCQYSAKDGMADDWHLVHLGKFALGGFGVVMTEAAAVEERGRISHADIGIWSDRHVAPLRRITDFIRGEGSLSAIQLAHAGRKASMQRPWHGAGPLNESDFARGERPWQIVGPMAEPVGEGFVVPHEMTPEDIRDVVKAFGDAAARSVQAGFDIAEIHGAHGYLIASFLSPAVNKRNDAYGGSREGRMRFALEVTEAVRANWPDDRPLFFRVSSVDGAENGWNLDDTVVLAKELQARGVDVVDCSSGGLTGSPVTGSLMRGPGFQVPFAAAVKQAGVTSMAVGYIFDGPQAEAILQAGDADLIAIGREAMFDPYWPHHAAAMLGADPDFEQWGHQSGWWLDKRAKAMQRWS